MANSFVTLWSPLPATMSPAWRVIGMATVRFTWRSAISLWKTTIPKRRPSCCGEMWGKTVLGQSRLRGQIANDLILSSCRFPRQTNGEVLPDQAAQIQVVSRIPFLLVLFHPPEPMTEPAVSGYPRRRYSIGEPHDTVRPRVSILP